MRRDVGVCLHFYPACQRPLTSRFGRCSRRATVPCAPAVHSEPAVIHVRSTRCAMAARSSSSPAASSVSSSPPPLKMSRIWSGGQKGAPRRVLPADGSGVPPADHARAAHGGHRPAARRENPTARSSFAAGIPLFTRLSTRWRGATPHGRRHDDPRLLSRKSLADFFQVSSQARTRTWRSKPCGSIPTGVGAIGSGCSNTRAFAGWRTSCGLIWRP